MTLLASKTTDVAALVGDLATENDAIRLARSEAPVKQITTGTLCHLEAAMVQNALEGWDLNDLDFLFIENVGNLVCPSSYDLGENLRLVLISVTEGEDKPLKYPTIFNSADVAVVTKMDLALAVEFDWQFGVRQYSGCSSRDAGLEALRQDRRRNGRVLGTYSPPTWTSCARQQFDNLFVRRILSSAQSAAMP